jgi:hypothetical protein
MIPERAIHGGDDVIDAQQADHVIFAEIESHATPLVRRPGRASPDGPPCTDYISAFLREKVVAQA